MTTTELIRTAGLLTLFAVLLAVLVVTVLRLVALPLAAAALGLDAVAGAAARALEAPLAETGGDPR